MPERLRLVIGRRRGEISVMTRDDDHRRKRPLPVERIDLRKSRDQSIPGLDRNGCPDPLGG